MKNNQSLIVLRFSSLGDIAMVIPVLIAFHKNYPDYIVNMVSNPQVKPLFDNFEWVNFISVDFKGEHKGLLGWVKLIKRIKQIPSKTIIDLHHVIRSNIINYIFKLHGYQVFVIEKGREEKRQFLSKMITQPLKSMHQRYVDTFSKASFKFSIDASCVLSINKPKRDIKRIGLAPFAKHKGKEMNIMHLVSLLEKFKNQTNIFFYIFGYGNLEKSIIEEQFCNFNTIENTIGKYTFSEELKLISSLDIMISMDSANGHLAAMNGIPVITLWGVTGYGLGYAPFNMPELNGFSPSAHLFPELPVSIYGKCNDLRLQEAINYIDINNVFNKINEILYATDK